MGIRPVLIIVKKRFSGGLLKAQKKTGVRLTENFAMYPASSVSALVINHPEAKYFQLGKITQEQVEDYAQRKKIPLEVAEKWLTPNLSYEPKSQDTSSNSDEQRPSSKKQNSFNQPLGGP